MTTNHQNDQFTNPNILPTGTPQGQSEQQRPQGEKPADDETTHFGYQTVHKSEKQAKVAEVFTSVARKYDVMSRL